PRSPGWPPACSPSSSSSASSPTTVTSPSQPRPTPATITTPSRRGRPSPGGPPPSGWPPPPRSAAAPPPPPRRPPSPPGAGPGPRSWGVFVATVVHKPADALTIVSLMLGGGARRPTAHLVNLGFALMIPLGMALFALGIGRLAPEAARRIAADALGFSAGT